MELEVDAEELPVPFDPDQIRFPVVSRMVLVVLLGGGVGFHVPLTMGGTNLNLNSDASSNPTGSFLFSHHPSPVKIPAEENPTGKALDDDVSYHDCA